jgi:hypothetical protein
LPVRGLPTLWEAVRYYRSPVTDYSYVSLWNGRAWETWSWDATLQARRLDVPYRVEAVLTTGELLCRSDTSAYVYSRDGDRKYSFTLGDLEFVAERYDSSGEAIVVFVLPIVTGDEGEQSVDFGVYKIKTRKLRTLE